MQRKIDKNLHLGQTVSTFDSIGKSSAIDKTASHFEKQTKKLKKSKG